MAGATQTATDLHPLQHQVAAAERAAAGRLQRPQPVRGDRHQHRLHVFRDHVVASFQRGPGARRLQQRDRRARAQAFGKQAAAGARPAPAPARSRSAPARRGSAPAPRALPAARPAASPPAAFSAARAGLRPSAARVRRRRPGSRATGTSGSGRAAIPAAGRCRPGALGFCVAITKNGSGRSRVTPSAVTWRSSIASSSADCVLGVARLISSASSTCVKTGPGWNTKPFFSRSKIEMPTTSAGSRSLVNCTRLKRRPSDDRQRVRQRGLADARHVLDQQVAAGQQADQRLANLQVLADDDLADLAGGCVNFAEHEIFRGGRRAECRPPGRLSKRKRGRPTAGRITIRRCVLGYTTGILFEKRPGQRRR